MRSLFLTRSFKRDRLTAILRVTRLRSPDSELKVTRVRSAEGRRYAIAYGKKLLMECIYQFLEACFGGEIGHMVASNIGQNFGLGGRTLIEISLRAIA